MRRRSERGAALILALMTIALLATLATAAVMTTSTETLIATSFTNSEQALYAADAALEWTLADLASVEPDWSAVATGAVRSALVDGPPDGARTLTDGAPLDLGALVRANAPLWPYAHSRLADALGDAGESGFYVVVFVGPDGLAANRLTVRAEAFGPRGAHKALVATIAKGERAARLERWREIR